MSGASVSEWRERAGVGRVPIELGALVSSCVIIARYAQYLTARAGLLHSARPPARPPASAYAAKLADRRRRVPCGDQRREQGASEFVHGM